jgi:hypothetical protein
VLDGELLDQKVICQHGPRQRVLRWWRGIRPETGVIIQGWTGKETLEETERIMPLHTFVVEG